MDQIPPRPAMVAKPYPPRPVRPPGIVPTGTTLEIARWYAAAGLSVIPVRPGSRPIPAVSGWRQFSSRRPTDRELGGWFADGGFRIGVVCGAASGNLIVFNYRTDAVYQRCVAEPTSARILANNPIVVAPAGGRHVWVRTDTPLRGKVPARTVDNGVLAEMRGDGQFVVAPGGASDGGDGYVFVSLGWLSGGGA